MVKIKMRKRVSAPKRRVSKVNRKQKTFGAVAAINTAPVAIGNSVRGSKAQVLQTKNGLICRGRDFAFPATGTGSVQTWTMCGGTPLAPAAFSDSAIRQYLQMYQKFKWRRLTAHYITSSPTSSNGDVIFYYQKNRNSVFLNQTSTQLLPYVMSDPNTVIGPQWTNHSVVLDLKPTWRSTDYGMSSVLDSYAQGDLFLLSKTSTTDSPGYVIFDYEIEFAELQISPRLLALPLTRCQWWQTSVGGAGITNTVNTAMTLSLYGNNLSGSASANPTGIANGDIYKVILDKTNSSTLPVSVTAIRSTEAGGYVGINVVDGTTLYVAYNGSAYTFYATVEEAVVNGSGIQFSATDAAVTFTLQLWLSFVTSIGTLNTNPNF